MVGEKFKAVRKARNLTLEGAASRLGIKSSGHLSMIERGEREPSDSLVNNFKLTFSVSETWWETGEGEMFQAPDIEGLKMANPTEFETAEHRLLWEECKKLSDDEALEMLLALRKQRAARNRGETE